MSAPPSSICNRISKSVYQPTGEDEHWLLDGTTVLMRKGKNEPVTKVALQDRLFSLTQRTGFAASLIVAVGLLVYWSSFDGKFIFDDFEMVVQNHYLRRLWPVWDCLFKWG